MSCDALLTLTQSNPKEIYLLFFLLKKLKKYDFKVGQKRTRENGKKCVNKFYVNENGWVGVE